MDIFQPQAHLLLVSDVPRGNRGSRFWGGGLLIFFSLIFHCRKAPVLVGLRLVLSGALEKSKEMQLVHRHRAFGSSAEEGPVRRGV